MIKRDLHDIANEMSDLDSTIGIMENYISCLQIQAKKAGNDDDRYLILWSLTGEKGLANIMANLEIMSDKLAKLTNEVGDHARENG